MLKRGCPFCKCNSTQVLGPNTKPNTSTHAKGFQIECLNCGARGPSGMATPASAGSVWTNGIEGTERKDEPYWTSEHSFQGTKS